MDEQTSTRALLADNLRATRARRRLTQDDIAASMQRRGFNTWRRPTVSLVERYQRAVTAEELVALAEILDMATSELLRHE